MKSRIKTYNPIIIQNRLVPKKESSQNMTSPPPCSSAQLASPKYQTDDSNSISSIQRIVSSSEYLHAETDKSPTRLRSDLSQGDKISNLTPPIKPLKTDLHSISISPKKYYAPDTTLVLMTEKGLGSSGGADFKTETRQYQLKIQEGKQKLQEMNQQLSFYERLKAESGKQIQSKSSEILELRKRVEEFLFDKQKQSAELFNQNKKIKELSEELNQKDEQIKEFRANRQKLLIAYRDKLEGQGMEKGQDVLKTYIIQLKSQCDDLQAQKRQKEVIFQKEKIQLISSHEKKLQNAINECSKRLEDTKEAYQERIIELKKERIFFQKKQQQKRTYLEKRHTSEKEFLQDLHEKKIKELKSEFQIRIEQLKDLLNKKETIIKDLNAKNQADAEGWQEEKKKSIREVEEKSRQNLKREEEKFNKLQVALLKKYRNVELQVEKLKTCNYEKDIIVDNLTCELDKKKAKIQQFEKVQEFGRSKYKKMEELWRQQNKIASTSKSVIDELQNQNEKLTKKIENLSADIANREAEKHQQLLKTKNTKETYSKIVAEKNRQINRLKNELSQRKKEKEEAYAHFEIEEEKQKLSEIMKKKYEQKINDYIISIQELNTKIDEIIKHKNKYQKVCQNLELEVETKNKEIVGLIETISEKEQVINFISSKLQEEEKTSTSSVLYSQLKLQLTNVLPKVNELMQELAEGQEQLETLKQKLEKLWVEKEESQKKMIELETKIGEASRENVEQVLDCLQKENEDLISQINELKRKNKELQVKQQQINGQRDILKLQVNSLQSKLQQNQQKIIPFEKVDCGVSTEELLKRPEEKVETSCGSDLIYEDQGSGDYTISNLCDGYCQAFIEYSQSSVQIEVQTRDAKSGEDETISFCSQHTQYWTELRSQGVGEGQIISTSEKQIQCNEITKQYADKSTEVEEQNQVSEEQEENEIQVLIDSQTQTKKVKLMEIQIQTEKQAEKIISYQSFASQTQSEFRTIQMRQDETQTQWKEGLDELYSAEDCADKNSEEEEGKISDEMEDEEIKDDESSAKEEDEQIQSKGDTPDEHLAENQERLYTVVEMAELLEEIHEKEEIIQQLKQYIDDYKEMVVEMKQKIEYQENYEINYKEVLQIFSLEEQIFSPQTHNQLIETINNFTSKISEMMLSINKLEEVTQENEALAASKKKLLKQLKKCNGFIEKAQKVNEELENKLAAEMQRTETEMNQIKQLLDDTNQDLLQARTTILNSKVEKNLSTEQFMDSESVDDVVEEEDIKIRIIEAEESSEQQGSVKEDTIKINEEEEKVFSQENHKTTRQKPQNYQDELVMIEDKKADQTDLNLKVEEKEIESPQIPEEKREIKSEADCEEKEKTIFETNGEEKSEKQEKEQKQEESPKMNKPLKRSGQRNRRFQARNSRKK